MALSEQYMHESACGLQEDGHVIADEFVDVIRSVVDEAERWGIDLDWGAAGCGSCFHTDADGAIFWIAQNDADVTVPLNYDIDDDASVTQKELGELIVDTAERMDIPVSWNGDTSSCVFLGTDRYYFNFEPGTRVKGTPRYGSEKTGTVLDPEIVNGPYKEFWRVFDQREYDGRGAGGELVATFRDYDHAVAFLARTFGVNYERGYDGTDDWEITRERHYGTRDGDNLVIWDGHDSSEVASSTRLEEL